MLQEVGVKPPSSATQACPQQPKNLDSIPDEQLPDSEPQAATTALRDPPDDLLAQNSAAHPEEPADLHRAFHLESLRHRMRSRRQDRKSDPSCSSVEQHQSSFAAASLQVGLCCVCSLANCSQSCCQTSIAVIVHARLLVSASITWAVIRCNC